MRITITKGRSEDWIHAQRNDGTIAEATFPKKGPVPHDAVHLFVERELRLAQGFWGMVAAGHHPEELLEIAKAAGHASAKRAGPPDAAIVQLLQAERIVECFEADLWGGGGAAADLIALARTACDTSYVPLPAVFDEPAAEWIGSALGEFARDWIAAAPGHAMVLDWE